MWCTASILSVIGVLHQKNIFSLSNSINCSCLCKLLAVLVNSFQIYFYLMSIDSYFTRSTKATNDEPTPECSPHPSESSGSTITIPGTQVTPLQRQQAQTQEQLDNSLYPGHDPSARVGRCRGDGGEGERNKSAGSTKKRAPFVGDGAHASLDPDETLSAQPMADADDDSIFADSSQAPHGKAESKRGRGGCSSSCCEEAVCKQPISSWLLRHLAVQLTPPSVPQGPPPGDHSTYQGVAPPHSQEEGDQ